MTAIDDRRSPFSNVRGYQRLSYPHNYAIDFYWAFCKNNPTQIIKETFDSATGNYKPKEQHDFTYTYGNDGYPTLITLHTIFFGPARVDYDVTYKIEYR